MLDFLAIERAFLAVTLLVGLVLGGSAVAQREYDTNPEFAAWADSISTTDQLDGTASSPEEEAGGIGDFINMTYSGAARVLGDPESVKEVSENCLTAAESVLEY